MRRCGRRFTFKEDGRRGKTVESFNILADTGGSAEHTVVVGAHLDSVQEGPGIDDNGSGVAAVLETARWMKEAGITPANRVRFAFWGGEEDGLYGSQHYVDELSQAEIGQTAANLNVDMVASPNGVRSVHDGDGTDFGHAGPAGSKAIEDIFFRYFQENALPAETTPFDGGSDYDAFLSAGIPGGGLFTGDEKRKTQAQAQTYRRGGRQGPRSLLPRGLRHHRQHQPGTAQGNVRRPGLRHRGLRDGQDRLKHRRSRASFAEDVGVSRRRRHVQRLPGAAFSK